MEADRFGNASDRPVAASEVVAGGESVGVFVTKYPFAVGQNSFLEADRFEGASDRPVAGSEAGAGVESVGVFVTKDPFAVGQNSFFEVDRFGNASDRPVAASEAGAGGESVGVFGTKCPFVRRSDVGQLAQRAIELACGAPHNGEVVACRQRFDVTVAVAFG